MNIREMRAAVWTCQDFSDITLDTFGAPSEDRVRALSRDFRGFLKLEHHMRQLYEDSEHCQILSNMPKYKFPFPQLSWSLLTAMHSSVGSPHLPMPTLSVSQSVKDRQSLLSTSDIRARVHIQVSQYHDS